MVTKEIEMRSTIEMLSKRRGIIAISVLFICLVLGSYAESSILLQDHNVPEKESAQGLWAERHSYYLLPNPDCCRSLAQDGNYLWVATSAGVVRWNLKENTYRLFKADDDWSTEYAEKLGMLGVYDDSTNWGSDKARQYLKKWVTNAVEKVIVLSPGHVWVDTLKGAMIIHGGSKATYASVEDALAAIYHTELRPTLNKVVAMDKNEHLWWVKRTGDLYTETVRVLLHYDGTAWKSDEQVGITRVPGMGQHYYNINDILVDAQGNLWACNFRGIYQRTENHWQQALREARYGYGEMRLGTSGTLWAFDSGALARFTGNRWEVFKGQGRYKDFRLPGPYMGEQAVVLETPDGKLWFEASFVGSDTYAFVCFDGKRFSRASFCPVAAMSNNAGQTFAASVDRLFSYDNGKWKQLATPPFRILRLISLFGVGQKAKIIDDILVAEDGAVYVAAEREGLFRYQNGSWKRMSCDKAKQETKSIEQDVAEGMAKMSEEERFLVLGVGPVPEALVKKMHKAYVGGEGKELIKAGDQQLAEHVVQGKDSTSAISYYRLLSRNRKLAKASLHKKIEGMCASDYGEGWISLEIASYGPPVIEILLKIAKMGTAEQRALAIDSLSFMRDPKVVDELFGILGDLEKLDSLSYLRFARAAIMVGNPKGMDLLIEAATAERKEEKSNEFKIDDVRRTCREELNRVTQAYDDVPREWSAEKWKAWWEKHRDTWKPSVNLSANQLLAGFKAQHKVFREVAKRLEANQ